MATTLGPELRNLICEAFASRAFDGRLRIYSGTVSEPILLAEVPLLGTFSPPQNGETEATGFANSLPVASGVATFWELVPNPLGPFANQVLLRGTVGNLNSDADLRLANPSILVGLPLELTSFRFVAPL